MFPLATIINVRNHSIINNRRRCRRLIQRINRTAGDTLTANNIIISLNYLSSSFRRRRHHPSSMAPTASSSSSSASVVMNQARCRLVDHCYHSAQRFNRRISISSHGDINNRSDEYISNNNNVNNHPLSYTIGYSKTTIAVPLISSMVSLPEKAGEVDMITSLPDHIINYYRDASQCLRGATDASSSHDRASSTPSMTKPMKPLPRPKFFGARTEQVLLYQRMHANGMIIYTTQQPSVVNGVFGVPKGDDQQRLIIDGRYANRIFADARTWRYHHLNYYHDSS